MKVLFVSHLYPSPSRKMFGTFVRDYADALAKTGVDLEILRLDSRLPFFASKFSNHCKSVAITSPEYTGVRAIQFPVLPGLLAFNIYSARTSHQIAKAALEFCPDIIHAHNMFPDAALCLNAKTVTGAKLVVTTHGTDNRVHIHRRSRRRWVERVILDADHLIGVSKKVLNEILEIGVRPRKSSVIYNGVLHETPTIKLSKRPGRTVLCVCHLDLIEKGVDILINAFGRLMVRQEFSDCRLIIVGSGKYSEKLKSLASAVGVSETVDFLGALEPTRVHEEFAKCDIFCMPSWYEAFGVVYLEAMSHAKPVIAVAGQGISEILSDGKTALFVEPRSVDSCAAALEKLLQEPELRARIGSAGMQIVSKFSWQRAAAETIEIYNKLLSDRSVNK